MLFCTLRITHGYIIASRRQVVEHNRENKNNEGVVKTRVTELVNQRKSSTIRNRINEFNMLLLWSITTGDNWLVTVRTGGCLSRDSLLRVHLLIAGVAT